MATKNKAITSEKIKERFKTYLEKLRITNVQDYLDAGEDATLISFLQEQTGVEITSLYDIRNRRLCEDARNAMQHDDDLKSNNLFSQTLKKYANFLDDPKYNPQPKAKKVKSVTKQPKTPSVPGPVEEELTEGTKTHTEYERRYRNPELRKQCIAEYGWVCQVCGFDFAKAYGEDLGKNFIEVHHLEPISTFDQEHPVDPLTQLVPLCSNCHSMIHHGKNGPLKLRELRAIYQGPRWEIAKMKEDEPETE